MVDNFPIKTKKCDPNIHQRIETPYAEENHDSMILHAKYVIIPLRWNIRAAIFLLPTRNYLRYSAAVVINFHAIHFQHREI